MGVQIQIPGGGLEVGDTLDEGKYVLLDAPKQGGMSLVYRAKVTKGAFAGQIVAIKTPREDKPEADAKRAFHRELAALRAVGGHPNIIRNIDDGADDHGQPYLVLEWLQHTLVEEIRQRGRMGWEEWFKDIGSFILSGLAHAHGLEQCHRDLSPANIMFDHNGIVKISDFGLAVGAERVRATGTFAGHGSLPFTPPEPDTGINSRSRDCYSWAVLTAYALSGQYFNNIGQVRSFLAAADITRVPVEILQRAISDKPEDRQRMAPVLQSELREFEYRRLMQDGHPRTVRIEGMTSATQTLCKITGTSELRFALSVIANELNQVCGCALDAIDEDRLRVVGCTLEITALFKDDRLLISGGKRLELLIAQKKRDKLLMVPVQFRPGNEGNALRDILPPDFREMLIQADFQQQQVRAQRERIALLEMWAKYLDEKMGRARKGGYKLRYTEATALEDGYVLRVAGEIQPELLGNDLVVRGGSSVIQLTLINVLGDELFVRARNRADFVLPPSGIVEKDPHREQVAIERQQQGLEMIRGRRSASHDAIAWITDPGNCPPPECAGVAPVDGLSPDKLAILDAALGVQSVMTVAGPPGTGKTTLIAALVNAYLKRYPAHRVLLASQTHVAIDNAIEKMTAESTINLVRIGNEDEEKIAESSKQFLIARRFRDWAKKIRARSSQYLNAYAEANQLNLVDVTISMLFVELNTIEDQLPGIESELLRLKAEQDRLEQEAALLPKEEMDDEDRTTVSETLAALDAAQDMQERKDDLLRQARDALGRLREIKGYGGNSLATMPRGERNEWVTAFYQRSGKAEQLRSLINIQQTWLASLSHRSEFEYAILSEARVVAGTCVGIARAAFFKDAFDLCIIDEAGKATATETLIPLSRSHRWILVGDRRQLPPFVDATPRTKGTGKVAKQETLLDRFDEKLPAECKYALKEQRRMCKSIGELIARVFYNDMEIENVRPDSDRSAAIAGLYATPVTWISTSRVSAREQPFRKSKRNPKEASIAVAAIERIAAAIPAGECLEIAVIAGYAAQARQIHDALGGLRTRRPELHINCNSVDAFQGKEADVCIYSVTRSNNEDELGFLKEATRLNVALSRARDALVIIGDDAFCRACPAPNPFVAVLRHIDTNPLSCIRVFHEGH